MKDNFLFDYARDYVLNKQFVPIIGMMSYRVRSLGYKLYVDLRKRSNEFILEGEHNANDCRNNR